MLNGKETIEKLLEIGKKNNPFKNTVDINEIFKGFGDKIRDEEDKEKENK